jgi:hypothetical protein
MPVMAATKNINAKMPPMISNANIAMILCKPRPSAYQVSARRFVPNVPNSSSLILHIKL